MVLIFVLEKVGQKMGGSKKWGKVAKNTQKKKLQHQMFDWEKVLVVQFHKVKIIAKTTVQARRRTMLYHCTYVLHYYTVQYTYSYYTWWKCLLGEDRKHW